MTDSDDLTEEEVQARLAGEATRGPRTFRGHVLAPLSRGLRDLHYKVLSPGDSGQFFDVALLFLLTEAQAPDEAGRLAKRTRLLAETGDTPTFRGKLSLLLDGFSDAEIEEARRLTDEILGVVEAAMTSIAPDPKKKEGSAAGEPSQTTTLSTLSTSPASSPEEPPSGSAGS